MSFVARAAGIRLRFPFHSGILAVARDTGLIADVATALVDLARSLEDLVPAERTAPLATYLPARASACSCRVAAASGSLQADVILDTSTALTSTGVAW